MNRIMIEPGKAGFTPQDLSFDWRPNLERIEAEAADASRTGLSDQWALAEALCWMDLIDAEIAALDAASRDDRAGRSRAQLLEWRRRVEAVIDTLKGVEAAGGYSVTGPPKEASRAQGLGAVSYGEKNLHAYGTA